MIKYIAAVFWLSQNFFEEVFGLKKKLIEVALPLDVINKASAREKSIRHGHPSTLHLWWARRPLATARAVLFASLVDDPSEYEDKFPTPEAQQAERERLFEIIGKLVEWENSGNEEIFANALAEIKKSVGEDLPAVLDPFAGGGTIPLEAQRLGLKAFASDLNPVAVMINKAMIELPAKFKNQPPVNPTADKNRIGGWRGAEGLAEDILYYGKLLKEKAFEKIGSLYPKADGKTVIAWLWARTVTCSNPACQRKMPLVHSFKLSTKQNVFVQPIVEGDNVRFEVRQGKDAPEGTVNRNGARCLHCGANVPLEHVRAEGKAGRLSAQFMAIVAEGERGRIYLAPDPEHEKIAEVEKPDDYPEQEMNQKCPDLISGRGYGFDYWHQLFTNRQLTALTTFSDLIPEIQSQVIEDGGSKDYADALAVYLAFLIDKLADYNSSFCSWHNSGEKIRNTFGRQAIPMNWDFAEANFSSSSSGSFDNMLEWIMKVIGMIPTNLVEGVAKRSALKNFPLHESVIVSTDPPYYDNISYAELSDFFYVWLRRPLKKIYPTIVGQMLTPKDDELIAASYRHDGSKLAAKKFFENGMFQVLQNIYEIARTDFPVTIYYAFKQQDTDEASTGWETMLTSLIRAGFQITTTLPMRTEMSSRVLARDTNALASSIVLACRKRPPENNLCDKSGFLRELKAELRIALDKLQQANIAPVDMTQAAIGPGISVYSRYERITDMNDNAVSVRDALKIINAELDEYFNGQSRRLDSSSQFCVDLFTQNAFNEINFGEADVLARAKNISVGGLEDSGAAISARGRVRLRDRDEIPALDDNRQLNKGWTKTLIESNCAWLWIQSLVKVFDKAGIAGCAELLTYFDDDTESLKNLAYRLYNICEKKNWAREGTGYNELVVEWQDILSKRSEFMQKKFSELVQGELF